MRTREEADRETKAMIARLNSLMDEGDRLSMRINESLRRLAEFEARKKEERK